MLRLIFQQNALPNPIYGTASPNTSWHHDLGLYPSTAFGVVSNEDRKRDVRRLKRPYEEMAATYHFYPDAHRQASLCHSDLNREHPKSFAEADETSTITLKDVERLMHQKFGGLFEKKLQERAKGYKMMPITMKELEKVIDNRARQMSNIILKREREENKNGIKDFLTRDGVDQIVDRKLDAFMRTMEQDIQARISQGAPGSPYIAQMEIVIRQKAAKMFADLAESLHAERIPSRHPSRRLNLGLDRHKANTMTAASTVPIMDAADSPSNPRGNVTTRTYSETPTAPGAASTPSELQSVDVRGHSPKRSGLSSPIEVTNTLEAGIEPSKTLGLL